MICPFCRSDTEKAYIGQWCDKCKRTVSGVPSVKSMVDSKNMTYEEADMHLRHARWIEENKDSIEFTEKGPSELRPKFERRYY